MTRTVTHESIGLGERLLDLAGVRSGLRLLAVAGASGAVALPAARRRSEVVAVDLAPTIVDGLVSSARLDLPDNGFDVSISLLGVSPIPDLGGGLREVARVTKPGGNVLVAALGEPQRVEFLGYVVAALHAAVDGFTPPSTNWTPPPGEIQRRLVAAGLADVHVEAVSWDMHFSSGAHLWNVATSTNPIGAALTAGLTRSQATAVRQVLDGMLRERSGGEKGGVLNAEMNVGIGTVPTRRSS